MNFEWNPQKAKLCLKKHGVSFEKAKTVFDDPLYLDFYDPDHSDEEHRYLMIGYSKKRRLLIVSYTERYSTIRIIARSN
ncbi:BrnT family toxin [Candidatus Halobeggiatoa sp. HSG11]|nr:BrnT family toxin [Candidatus Halobeggiatoa sp. HSG11]